MANAQRTPAPRQPESRRFHVAPLRDSALAPINPQWTAIVRQEYALEGLIKRKLKLLTEIQANRELEELADQAMEIDVRGTKKHVFSKTNRRSY